MKGNRGEKQLMRQANDVLWFINDLARIHLTGERVGGRLSVVEFTAPPGDMPPLHRHEREDELFYVLEGRITIHQPGRHQEAEAGSAVFAERGIAHAYQVSDDGPARFLVIATPAGFEDFVAEIARPAEELRLPDPSQPDPEKMAAISARYGIQLLGPPGTLP
jgi:quercetin dioxygenase-like cupin family protein